MRFYLGTHEPTWLERSSVPLFISAVRLRARCKHKLPKARVPWALDSGGFSELSLHGKWTVSSEDYAEEVIRWAREIGMLEWAAIQDWMCEPWILEKTGLSVREHQIRTIESYGKLRRAAPEIPWVPVVQGWELADYIRHVEMYREAGYDLRELETVGVGSVCRRQGTREGAAIMRELGKLGLAIHAFGIKTQGLQMFGDRITSADSMAWSFVARKRNIKLPGCTHKTCGNCFDFAMTWQRELLEGLGDMATASGLLQTEMPW